ncbi:DUF362 domain-containing protein [bacterium]|nr:DUF362 domain-containing protein [bacterium]
MKTTRREFIKTGITASAAALLANPIPFAIAGKKEKPAFQPVVMVSKGGSPAENVRKVMKALGGMKKFVKKGDRVLLKPNCITSAKPEAAINTHPDVVGEITRMCMEAGAREVLAVGHDDPSCHRLNGIGEALEKHGGSLKPANSLDQYQTVNLPRGLILRETAVVKELLEYDVFINLPIAKHHAGAQLTMGLKNYMGLTWDRVIMHRTDLDQAIADLATVRRPDLVVVDATRILLSNGPSGPGPVREENTIIASIDPLAADSYAASLFKLEPRSVKHLKYAYDMGLGELYTDKMEINIFSAG